MRRAARFLLAVLLVALGSCAREDPGSGLPGVSLAQLREQVEYLASDALGGREVGSAGIALAEKHIAGYFTRYGLRPLPGSDGLFQEFSLYRTGFAAASTTLTLRTSAGAIPGVPGKDFRPFDFSGSGGRSALVVFAGYGITAPEYGYDDYQGLPVAGKYVLVLRHEPGNADPRSPFAGTANTAHAFFRAKAENAGRRGAVGMLLVDDPLSSGREEDLSLLASYSLEPPSAARDEVSSPGGFLAVHLSRALVEQLLRGTGLNLRRLQAAVDDGGKPVDLPLGDLRAELRVPERETLRIQARNVVGFLEGRDPVLREQWILIGAHHDHLGSTQGPGDAIFNGADDNASGVTGVLALARLFTRRGAWRAEEPPPADRRLTAPLRLLRALRLSRAVRLLRAVRLSRALWLSLLPRRSLVFATFSAEEQGLFGSQVLARELAAGSSGRLVRMLNLDMIGRNPGQPVHVLADRSAGELREVVERAAFSAGGPVAGAQHAPPAAPPTPRFSAGHNEMASDHASFFEKGIPYLFFFTGLHADYHGVNDEADQLSYPRLAEVIRLAWRVASLLADAP